MASSTASTTTPLRHAFERRVEDVKPMKSDINALILDYLTTEGYPSAAAKFSSEANLRPQQEEKSVQDRQRIQHAIHSGRIEDALKELNDHEPDVLEKNPPLHFALLRLQLVELIRASHSTPDQDPTAAFDFAQTHLASRATTNPEFTKDLERTMGLVIFSPDNLDAEIAAILHPNLRREVADNVNKAILKNQHQIREAAIRRLVRLRSWAEDTARESKKDIPARLELGLDNGSNENGHEPMIT